jgi:predicted RNase H-like nuclease (RuvC/YqgF family)
MKTLKEYLILVKDFVNKHWKIIVVCICACLLLGQCSSCNRDNRVDRLTTNFTTQIDSLSNTIKERDITISNLQSRIEDMQGFSDNLTSVATGNQNEANNRINILERENENLKTEIRVLIDTCNALRIDNKRLNNQVVDLMVQLENN